LDKETYEQEPRHSAGIGVPQKFARMQQDADEFQYLHVNISFRDL
jgi:hypothetical protein